MGLRGRLAEDLRRLLLPYWAVMQADLAVLLRSWALRAWIALSALTGLLFLLGDPSQAQSSSDAGTPVVAALFQLGAVPAVDAGVRITSMLLSLYVVLWTTLVVFLTAGAVSSERGVVADSVLSRGISRWRYFFGKWTARVLVVTGSYALVMLPCSTVLWLGSNPSGTAPEHVVPAASNTTNLSLAPAGTLEPNGLRLSGACFALAAVGAVLVAVASCGVALSACLSSTIAAVAALWVCTYGTGLVLAFLDVQYLSPARLIQGLPRVLQGDFTVVDQCRLIGCWSVAALVAALGGGILFSRRDV